MPLTVVLGPRRSGKSAVAERLAAEPRAPVVYLAPLTVTDDELRARVAAHRARRPSHWRTVESPDPLAALAAIRATDTVLLDSLGTWVSEVLWRAGALDPSSSELRTPGERTSELTPGAPDAGDVVSEAAHAQTITATLLDGVAAFAGAAADRPGRTIVVAEEAGWGPVPPSPATRAWLDTLGDATQACAARADRVLLVVAGRTLELP